MPYGADDLRSKLATATKTATAERFSAADYVKFYEEPPFERTATSSTWYARGQNFVFVYSEISGPTEFGPWSEQEEQVLLLLDEGLSAEVQAPGESVTVPGQRMVVLPPGRGSATVTGTGRVVRLVRSNSVDAALALNADSYAEPHENIPPFVAWPEPVGGYKLRVYDLTVPALSNPPFRLYRCTTFMVNYINPVDGPRDPSKLSPHYHDDFEQCSVAFEGEYIHHIRWPWTTDRRVWREDQHELCASPSVTIIPPPSIHTSEAVGSGQNHLVDIFSPPRVDFSSMEGWVLNAADYPMPEPQG
jgi:hypothetical protein